MTDYKTIFGRKIKFLTSDLDTGEAEGEIFYSDTDKEFKIAVATGAWASGTAMSTSRTLAGISGGTQTATLAYAGYLGGPGNTAATESYNGSGWSSGGNVNTARRGGAGVGTQTAALLVAGYSTESTTNVEEYNGTSWTEVTNVPNANRSAGGGIQTNAMIFANGGTDSSTYDGTNWSSGDALPAAMTQGSGATSTAILASIPPPSGTVTLEYTGSWAAGGSLNTARPSGGICAHSGPVTSAVMAGTRAAPPSARVGGITEMYDGTSWTTSPATQGTARNSYMISAGSNTAAVLVGGAPYTTATEEFNFGALTVGGAAWASSNNIGTARDAHGAGGTQTAGIIFGGNKYPGNTENTELYDGSSWTETANLNTARRQTTGCGTQTAALCAGGYTTANSAATEEWNGSAWTSSNNLATNRRNAGHFGVQTAAVYCGGYDVPDANSTVIQNYDGSSWTNNPASLNTGGNDIAATGSSTAGVIFGYSNNLNGTEEWNGSSMSTGNTMTTSKYGRASANQAPSENALSAGGGIPAQTTCEGYDGTTWSSRASISTATNSSKGGGTATAAFIAGGGPGAGPIFNTSLEYTEGATSLNLKTITDS